MRQIMEDEIHYMLYGLPFYQGKINPELFEKEKIIGTIKDNFLKQPIRDNWGKGEDYFITHSNFHHSYTDEENVKMKKPDYTSLDKIYTEIITKYVKIYCRDVKNFYYEVINYTANNRESYLRPHNHHKIDLSLIHYVGFNKQEHLPTIFLSPYFFADTIVQKQNFKKNSLSSWCYSEWMPDVQEDSFIVYPSILKHYVKCGNSNDLRITIVTNVKFNT